MAEKTPGQLLEQLVDHVEARVGAAPTAHGTISDVVAALLPALADVFDEHADDLRLVDDHYVYGFQDAAELLREIATSKDGA